MRQFIYLLFITIPLLSFSQWQDMNTGINDDLTDIYFLNSNKGFVCGHNGVYYTLNGGATNPSWQRFEITNNTQ